MRNKFILLSLLMSFVVASMIGCASDGLSKYYGVWEAATNNHVVILEQNGKGSAYFKNDVDSRPEEIRWTIKNVNKKVICEITYFTNEQTLRELKEENPELDWSSSVTYEYDFTNFPNVVYDDGDTVKWKKVN